VASYILERFLRQHDLAMYNFLSGPTVDYGTIAGTPRNNVGIFVAFGTPDRAMALMGDELTKRGWLTATDEDGLKLQRDEYLKRITPFISFYRTELSPDRQIAGGIKSFLTKFFNYSNSTWSAYQWPTTYRAEYVVDIYSRYSQEHEHVLAYFESLFNAPGAGLDEVYIPVDHLPPWGTIQQVVTRTGFRTNTTLEGDVEKRIIRTTFNLSLRVLAFKAQQSSAGSVARIGPSVNGPGTPRYPSGNHFMFFGDASDVPATWPVVGNAQVVVAPVRGPVLPWRGTSGFTGYRDNLNGQAFDVTFVQQPTDMCFLWKHVSEVGESSNAFSASLTKLNYISNTSVNLVIEQSDASGSNVQSASVVTLPARANWTPVRTWTYLSRQVYGGSLAGTGATPSAAQAEIMVRDISSVTWTPPGTLTSPSGSVTVSATGQYRASFSGLPTEDKYLFCVGGLSAPATVFIVSDADVSATATGSGNAVLVDLTNTYGAVIPFPAQLGGVVTVVVQSLDGSVPAPPATLTGFPFRLPPF